MADDDASRARVRAGHADRERAVQALSTHFTDGRLDTREFDLRVGAAYAAVYVDELTALFADLPGTPDGATGSRPSRSPRTPDAAPDAELRRWPGPWSPPPQSRSQYGPNPTRPSGPAAPLRAALTVLVVVLVAVLVFATRGFALAPLVVIALVFWLGGPRGPGGPA